MEEERKMGEMGKGRRLVRCHEDLVVYQMAFDAAMKIFQVSKRFPVEERYSLTDQIRRSSRSVFTSSTNPTTGQLSNFLSPPLSSSLSSPIFPIPPTFSITKSLQRIKLSNSQSHPLHPCHHQRTWLLSHIECLDASFHAIELWLILHQTFPTDDLRRSHHH